jgi:hypothetical protein
LDLLLCDEELTAQLFKDGSGVVEEDQFLATSKNNVLGDFDTEWTHSTDEDAAFSLLGHCLNSHGANIPAPSIFDLIIIYIDLMLLNLLVSEGLIAHVDVFNLDYSATSTFLRLSV